MDDELRVEVDLKDERHGYSLRERLRGHDLDDEARRRLGRGIVVTRAGSRLFLYANDEPQAREAERVVRELLDAEGLTADIALTRRHPVQEDWQDVTQPVPRTEQELREEYVRREEAEAREAETEGRYEWHVVAHLSGREEAAALAERLEADGIPVARRWRWVVAGAVTEEGAEEVAASMRAAAPTGTEVSVEVNLSAVHVPALLFLPS